MSFCVIILLTFIFCYARILMAVRHQANVMVVKRMTMRPVRVQRVVWNHTCCCSARDRWIRSILLCWCLDLVSRPLLGGLVLVFGLGLAKWSCLHRCSFIMHSVVKWLKIIFLYVLLSAFARVTMVAVHLPLKFLHYSLWFASRVLPSYTVVVVKSN